LRTLVFAQRLARSFMSLLASQIDQRLDRAPANAKGHRAETGDDTRQSGNLVPQTGQHDRVGVMHRPRGR